MQVQTIDKCQGDEADAVILSLVMAYDAPQVAADEGHARLAIARLSIKLLSQIKSSDFAQHANRVNVGISRMRYLLVVVSSQHITVPMKKFHGGQSLWGQILQNTYAGGAKFHMTTALQVRSKTETYMLFHPKFTHAMRQLSIMTFNCAVDGAQRSTAAYAFVCSM